MPAPLIPAAIKGAGMLAARVAAKKALKKKAKKKVRKLIDRRQKVKELAAPTATIEAYEAERRHQHNKRKK